MRTCHAAKKSSVVPHENSTFYAVQGEYWLLSLFRCGAFHVRTHANTTHTRSSSSSKLELLYSLKHLVKYLVGVACVCNRCVPGNQLKSTEDRNTHEGCLVFG